MNEEMLLESLKVVLDEARNDTRQDFLLQALITKQFELIKKVYNPLWRRKSNKAILSDLSYIDIVLFDAMQNGKCDLETVKFACENYRIEINHVLLVSRITPYTDRVEATLLDLALAYGKLDIADYLVGLGASFVEPAREKQYTLAMERTPVSRVLKTFDYMYDHGLKPNFDDLIFAIFKVLRGSEEIISWIVEHGDGYRDPDLPNREESLLDEAVRCLIREEIFSTEVWLEKIEALLKTGINPNPEVSWGSSELEPLLHYVDIHSKNKCARVIRVKALLEKYDEIYRQKTTS